MVNLVMVPRSDHPRKRAYAAHFQGWLLPWHHHHHFHPRKQAACARFQGWLVALCYSPPPPPPPSSKTSSYAHFRWYCYFFKSIIILSEVYIYLSTKPGPVPIQNPYPYTRVRVLTGTGTGSSEIPPGYPCSSLVTQLRALRVTVGCADVWMCGSREGSPLTTTTTRGQNPKYEHLVMDMGVP